MKGVILCAGLGKRLRPITFTTPKPLIPLAGKPALIHSVESLKAAGVDELILVVNPRNAEIFRDVFGDGGSLGVSMSYAVQERPLGLADALRSAREMLEDEPFVMYLGDNLILTDIGEFISDFEDKEALIALKEVEDPKRFGVAVLENGMVKSVVEKPSDPPSRMAIVGLYAFRSSIFEAIDSIEPSWRGEFEITDAIAKLIEMGKTVGGHVIDGWWRDIGRFEDLLIANSHMLSVKRSWISRGEIKRCSIKGYVEVGKSSSIEDSEIEGPVMVGENSRVRGSRLGPDVSVGDGVVIENSEVYNSIIMDGAILKNVRLRDSVIGKGVKLSDLGSVKGVVGDNGCLKGEG